MQHTDSFASSEEQILRDGQMDEDVIRKTTEYRVSISSQVDNQDSHIRGKSNPSVESL